MGESREKRDLGNLEEKFEKKGLANQERMGEKKNTKALKRVVVVTERDIHEKVELNKEK